MIRIYAIADLHGRRHILSGIRQNVTVYRPDILILAGDIVSRKNPLAQINEISRLSIPVMYIRGNTDPYHLDQLCGRFTGISSLHNRSITFNKIHFTGISGTLPLPFNNRVALKEHALLAKTAGYIKPHHTVLVVHPPPYGILDLMLNIFHTGSKNLRLLVEKTQPRLLICGHIHGKNGQQYLGSTLIVNCSAGQSGMGYILDIQENTPINVMRLE